MKTWPTSRRKSIMRTTSITVRDDWISIQRLLKSCYKDVQGFKGKHEYNERRNLKVNWNIIFFENWKIQYPEWKLHWMSSIAHWLDTAEENIYECANIVTIHTAAPRNSVTCGVISASLINIYQIRVPEREEKSECGRSKLENNVWKNFNLIGAINLNV